MQEDTQDTQVKSEFSTLRGDLDTRPGHYYVVSYRQGSRPAQGYHLLAGPWPTHKEADDQVAAVQAWCEQHGGTEAYWQHYITARREIVDGVEAASSKLGSDATRWMPREPLKVGDTVWLVTDEKLPSVGASVGVGDRFSGVVTKLSKLRIGVRFGHTGFGQREYVFTNKGELAPYTGSNVLGKCHLELT